MKGAKGNENEVPSGTDRGRVKTLGHFGTGIGATWQRCPRAGTYGAPGGVSGAFITPPATSSLQQNIAQDSREEKKKNLPHQNFNPPPVSNCKISLPPPSISLLPKSESQGLSESSSPSLSPHPPSAWETKLGVLCVHERARHELEREQPSKLPTSHVTFTFCSHSCEPTCISCTDVSGPPRTCDRGKKQPGGGGALFSSFHLVSKVFFRRGLLGT